jgi:hypothetical protein
MPNKHFIFSVNLTYSQCEELYLQAVKYLIVTSIDGKRIQLPKQNMSKFLTPSGLKGHFKMEIDDKHKIVSIDLIK